MLLLVFPTTHRFQSRFQAHLSQHTLIRFDLLATAQGCESAILARTTLISLSMPYEGLVSSLSVSCGRRPRRTVYVMAGGRGGGGATRLHPTLRLVRG